MALFSVIFLCAILLLLPPGSSAKAKGDAEPVQEEVPYIICETCKKAIDRAWDEATDLRRSELTLHEDQILDVMAKICDPSQPVGHWIAKQDVVTKPKKGSPKASKSESAPLKGGLLRGIIGRLKAWLGGEEKPKPKPEEEKPVVAEVVPEDPGTLGMISHPNRQKCNQECETVALACTTALGEHLTSIGGELFGGKTTAKALKVKYCEKNEKACAGGTSRPPLPQGFTRVDEPFKEMTEEEIRLEEMMASMKPAEPEPEPEPVLEPAELDL